MKKIVLILFTSLLAVSLSAETSAIRLLMHAERLWKSKEYVEAIDSAARVLTIMPNNSAAKNFLHDHWDKMVHHVNSTLEKNADESSLEQSLVRLETYRLMAEISDYLREVDMPLVGTNWQWYPELYYSQGDYDSERMHVYHMLLEEANACLRSYDTEGAREHLLTALRYLNPGDERESNRANLQAAIIRNMKHYDSTNSLPDAIFAYELTNLSDALRSDTSVHLDTIEHMKPVLREHVGMLYNAKADELLQQGDSAKAADYRAMAEDWLHPVEPDPER
ncbi:MAG: hypothetical protein J5635_06130 [Paludibacteraceae bacterium]|nr:hypothetical protein [Paludibacteraceae bacterium]